MAQQHPNGVPPLDRLTIEFMDRRFPERCPNPSDTEREIWMKAGERRAVVHLLTHLKNQEAKI